MILQIQSIIYNNEKADLLKSLSAIKQAISVYHKDVGPLEVKIAYGDGSPEQIFRPEDISEIEKLLGTGAEFEYRVFGFNSGTAKGHNLLRAGSTADFIMIMNPDVIIEPRCIVNLMNAFERDSQVGMVEARQTPLEHAKEYDMETGETEWASTACTIIKMDVFDEINGFDEDTFFLYCDDLDFSWHIRLNGYKVIYVPSAIVYHAKSLSIEGKWKPTGAEVYYSAEAAILLAYKWSNQERAEQLVHLFKTKGGPGEQKAAEEFERRKRENRLPVQLDSEHKIAKFIKDDYCEMRFYY